MKKNMLYDYSKLRGRIREMFDTQEDFAKEIVISATSLSNKLNNIVPFNQDEILKSIEVLKISSEQIQEYFFTQKV